MLFFKYKRFIGTIYALEELGYICQNNGFFESDRGLGRQSRMWATEKLVMFFQAYQFDHPKMIINSQPQEIIQLKDDKKKLIGYPSAPTKDMRERLIDYNDFMSQQEITVDVPEDGEINLYYLMKLSQHSFGGLEVNKVVPMGYSSNSSSNVGIPYTGLPPEN